MRQQQILNAATPPGQQRRPDGWNRVTTSRSAADRRVSSASPSQGQPLIADQAPDLAVLVEEERIGLRCCDDGNCASASSVIRKHWMPDSVRCSANVTLAADILRSVTVRIVSRWKRAGWRSSSSCTSRDWRRCSIAIIVHSQSRARRTGCPLKRVLRDLQVETAQLLERGGLRCRE